MGQMFWLDFDAHIDQILNLYNNAFEYLVLVLKYQFIEYVLFGVKIHSKILIIKYTPHLICSLYFIEKKMVKYLVIEL